MVCMTRTVESTVSTICLQCVRKNRHNCSSTLCIYDASMIFVPSLSYFPPLSTTLLENSASQYCFWIKVVQTLRTLCISIPLVCFSAFCFGGRYTCHPRKSKRWRKYEEKSWGDRLRDVMGIDGCIWMLTRWYKMIQVFTRVLMGSLTAVLLRNSGFSAYDFRSNLSQNFFMDSDLCCLHHDTMTLDQNSTSCEAIRYVLYIMTECANLGGEW